MSVSVQRVDVLKAAEDLRQRTLSSIPRQLDRFVYLASTRDYNTGMYYHDGLSASFSSEAACEALANCHREAFQALVSLSVEQLVGEMEAYMASQNHPREFISVWKSLQPYRVAVPVGVDAFSAEFLFSNFRIALAIAEERLRSPRHSKQAA